MPHQDYIGSDGKPWPSATTLTALLPKNWLYGYDPKKPEYKWGWYTREVKKFGWQGWLNCYQASQEGMAIGREVHSLLEGFIKKEPFEISGLYDSQRIADALYDYVNPKVDEYIALEPHLKSEELKIHGSADMIVRLNYCPGLWIGDWKARAGKSDTDPLQLAIYAICWSEEHPDQLIDQGFIPRVDKKSKNLNVHIDEYKNLKQYKPVVQALREIWTYSNGH